MLSPPRFILLAGPNGAGKSTTAASLLPLGHTFLNADEIAKELNVTAGERKEFMAGRALLTAWDRLAEERTSFTVESTLASRSLAPRIQRLIESDYRFHLIYFWLPSADLAVARVAERVRL